MSEKIVPTEDCIFCQIVSGEIPADIVFRNEMVSAFRDIQPVAPTHILIIPNQHIPSNNQLDEAHKDVAAGILTVVPELARQEGIEKSGYRLIMNTGADGGQEVMHVHLHLIGGQKMKHLMG